MITSLVAALELIFIITSVSLVFYNLMKGDNKRSTHLMLLLNLCLLWMVLI
ncbi:MAG: hypothetical protein II396_06990 [Methanobrevibacter sp.]|nr:hypothetical protein [Methanobrevibacter sp.]